MHYSCLCYLLAGWLAANLCKCSNEMTVTGVQLFCFKEQLLWSRTDAPSWSRAWAGRPSWMLAGSFLGKHLLKARHAGKCSTETHRCLWTSSTWLQLGVLAGVPGWPLQICQQGVQQWQPWSSERGKNEVVVPFHLEGKDMTVYILYTLLFSLDSGVLTRRTGLQQHYGPCHCAGKCKAVMPKWLCSTGFAHYSCTSLLHPELLKLPKQSPL